MRRMAARRALRLLVAVTAIVALSGGAPVGGAVNADNAEEDRADTASHTAGPPRVVAVARADDPVDALAASAVAAQLGGTVLLTPRDRLGADAREGIGEMLPDIVVIVGGEAALSDQVRQDLEDLAAQPEISFTVERVSGPNRMATATALSRYLVTTVPYYMALRGRNELNRVASATGEPSDPVAVSAGGSAVLTVDVSAMPPGWLDLTGGTEVESDDAISFTCRLRLDGADVAGSRRRAFTDNPEDGTSGGASGFGGCQTSATVQMGPEASQVELWVDTASSLEALERSLTARFVPHDAEGHRP